MHLLSGIDFLLYSQFLLLGAAAVPRDLPWLEQHGRAVLGMVAADGMEVHVAGYLRSVARDLGLESGQPPSTRVVAIALWHVAKAALVRDFAARGLRGEVPVNAPTEERLSRWLVERLLTPSELALYEQEARAVPDSAEPDSLLQ